MTLKRVPQIKMKIWIEIDGIDVFGKGRLALLEAVDKTGSISQAAASMGMSYRAAWGKITDVEHRLGFKLVERHPGNRERGTTLTADGVKLLNSFNNLQKSMEKDAKERFEIEVKKIFEIDLDTENNLS